MARRPSVAIIGGGIGGLAACLALHRRGIAATVYEQAGHLSEIGAGLTLSPNALKAFRALGVEDAALTIGWQAAHQVIRSWRSGRVIARQSRQSGVADRFGATFLTIHRADLLDVFARALPQGAVRLDAACTGVAAGNGVAVVRFADGAEIEADVVVGADGIHSAVRESLFGPDAPHFTGCVCWRGLVPREALPASLRESDNTSWWGPNGHVVHYLVRRGELVNFVAHYNSDAWTEESWTRECDRAELMETYARWHPSLSRLFESSERYYKWALYDRDPLDAWGRGRATLLGDSAHPMLPYLGQGACMAVEDGCILAEALARTPEDPEAALRDYERLRMPRTRRAQIGSRFRAKENHLASPFARLRRDVGLALRSRFGTDKSPLQTAWLYDYDVAAEDGFAAPYARQSEENFLATTRS
jgi:2-polyprenyl-6-methoxyphenol hydroxylase-like FAD-dependent oxidoreductase